MTPPSEDAPLSRRELRDRRARGEGAAPADPAKVAAEAAAKAELEERAAAGEVPAAEPAPAPATADDDGAPLLTRRQRRDVERARTAGVPVVSSEPAAPAAADRPKLPLPDAAESRARADRSLDDAGPTTAEFTSVTPAPIAAKPAEAEAPEPQPGEPEPAPVDEAKPHAHAQADDPEQGRRDAEVIQAATEALEEGVPEAARTQHHGPSDAFGRPLPVESADSHDKSVLEVVGQPFDAVLASGEESGSTTAPHALILPAIPSAGGLGGHLSSAGDVVLSGSIDLPPELSSTGQHPNYFEKPELDAMFEGDDDGDAAVGSGSGPISAARAVSTHSSGRDLIAPPAPQKNSKLLISLTITAGSLAVAVLGVVIVGLTTGSF